MEHLKEYIKSGEIWRHYKGKDYRIIAVSCNTEDLSWSVVYETIHDHQISTIWHRPIDMFLGSLEVDGEIVPRFTKIE